MTRVIIVHGFNSSPTRHWHPWLARELRARGYEVILPVMPHPLHPNKIAWQQALASTVGHVDKHTIFVTHSLGTIAVLQYLESQPEGTHCKGLIAVAPLVLPKLDILLSGFFIEPVDYAIIRTRIPHVEVFADPQDYIAPFINSEFFATQMHCALHACANKGHFDDLVDGVFEFPEVLDAVLAMEKH